METAKPFRFGSISACINGDHRYSTALIVFIRGDKALIEQRENGASGGMDGDGSALPYRVTKTRECALTAPAIVKTLKQMISTESPSVIKTYGKSSKRFKWCTVEETGLSVALCARALAMYHACAEGDK